MEKTAKTSGDGKATDDISANIFQISSPISNPDLTSSHQAKTAAAYTSGKSGTVRRSKVAVSVGNKDGSGSSGWHRSSDDNRR